MPVKSELKVKAKLNAPGFEGYKAKIRLEAIEKREPRGRLILVSGITPTAAGEGKSTDSKDKDKDKEKESGHASSSENEKSGTPESKPKK